MMATRKRHIEDAPEYAGAYTIPAVADGVAFRVCGWETTPTEDTEWDGIEERTGRLVVRMVGDDHDYKVNPKDVTALPRAAYCGECGQIGCAHDGLDRSEEEDDA